jgi:hypothetical protein
MMLKLGWQIETIMKLRLLFLDWIESYGLSITYGTHLSLALFCVHVGV